MHFWLVLNFSIKGVCCFSLLKWTLFSMIVTSIFLWSPQVRTTRIFTCMTSTRTSMLRHLLAILVQSLLWYRQPQENCSSQLHTTPQCRYTHIRSTGSKDNVNDDGAHRSEKQIDQWNSGKLSTVSAVKAFLRTFTFSFDFALSLLNLPSMSKMICEYALIVLRVMKFMLK